MSKKSIILICRVILSIIWIGSSASVKAEALSEKSLVNKELHLYLNTPECSESIRIYSNFIDLELIDNQKFKEPVHIFVSDIIESKKNSFYRVLLLDNSNTIYYVNTESFGMSNSEAKSYYVDEDEPVNIEKIKKTCVTNISPVVKEKFIKGEIVTLSQHKISNKAKQSEQLNLENIKHVKNSVPKMDETELCETYGWYLRSTNSEVEYNKKAKKIISDEIRKRKLKFNNIKLVVNKKIKVGISECELYASWGEAPEKNRSAGKWGLHTQHVYDNRAYVYTENGKVVSWQD